MPNPFAAAQMAAGYARSRPPVHSRILELVSDRIGHARCALDVGCGAGLSTKPLTEVADRCVGLEPAESMLRLAPAVAPAAHFVVGAAEAMPVASASVDLMTAAGSLNYADPDRFFPEAARVLTREGLLLVYDFSNGHTFRDSAALDQWYAAFITRYPWPPHEALELDPDILARWKSGFAVTYQQRFEIGLVLTPEFYRDYVLTETNVAFAVRSGGDYDDVRRWCSETLGPVWEGRSREVLFRGYVVSMSRLNGSPR